MSSATDDLTGPATSFILNDADEEATEWDDFIRKATIDMVMLAEVLRRRRERLDSVE